MFINLLKNINEIMQKYESTKVGQLKRRLKLWKKEAETGRYGLQNIARKMVKQIETKLDYLNKEQTK